MGDEKTHAQPGGKKDEPPAPVHRQAQPEQKTGPGRATEQRPAASPAGQTAALQQSVGNQRTNRILRAGREPGQEPRVSGVPVSHPQDAAEKEAEAVAKKITGEQPAHPRDHPGPAPGDPVKVAGDPASVHGDPDVVHRAQAAAPSAAHPAPAPPAAASILDHPGAGDPIPQPIRSTLESRLKADLRHVVVHHDARADTAVRALHARAVTRGNHIWLANDASPYDLSLMAHEVTHVLHHSDQTVHRQATGAGTGTPTPDKYYSGPEGTVDIVPATAPGDTSVRKTIEVPEVPYAEAKKLSGNTIYERFQETSKEVTRRPSGTDQVGIWRTETKKDTRTAAAVEALVKKGTTRMPPPSAPASAAGSASAGSAAAGTVDPAAQYLLQYSPSGPSVPGSGGAKNHQGVIIGTIEELAETALRPNWDKAGNFHTFDVDHLLELQVSGKDEFLNYWLWDSVANQSAGSQLSIAINNRVNTLLTAARDKHKGDPGPPAAPRSRNAVDRGMWRIRVVKLADGLPVRGTPAVYWTREETTRGDPVKLLGTVDTARAKELGLYPGGAKNYLVITVGEEGGALVRVPWAEGQESAKKEDLAGVFDTVLPFFKIVSVSYDTAKGKGSLTGEARNKTGLIDPKTITLDLLGFGPATGAMRVARLDGYKLAQKAGFFHFKPLSAITITEAGIRPYTGLYVRGVLRPSIPLLKDTSIDVVLAGGDISLEKTFSAKDIGAVGPIKITEGAFTISVGTRGLEVGGTLELALGTLATGSLSASVDSQFNFGLEGRINFDSTLFKPATLDFCYRKLGAADYQWGGSGLLGIPPGKVPGIQQATIRASYQNGTFTAAGSAKLSVPGLESGSLAITYGEREGISIGGTFALAPNPVIASGSVSATVSKRPPANRWQLSAQGTVKPKVPGVDTVLTATYEDGVFTVEGRVAYARGMLAGSIVIGLTNRPVDPQGRPAGRPHAGAPLRPYGGGTLTVKIAPWLQGTVGVQLQPDGSVQLMGEVALPESVTLFDPMEVRKTLFTIGLDIPILGVAAAGQRIGIFATIRGGLEASAGVGPGQIRQLGLKVRYNPEHEEQTAITGVGQLYIPAHAGLRLFLRGALGAGIPLVSAEAGLEIGGQLGVEAAVQAGVTVNWTPKQGLVIDAEASVSAEPKFRFDISGYVKVSADLFITTVSLYEKHWQLAAFEYGSGLRVGIRAPIHYEQGKPFTFSLSDVRFEVPSVDPKQILTDLVHKIA